MAMKQISSVTTINPKAPHSSTSTKPIATGVQKLSSSQQATALARLQEVANPTKVTSRVIDSVSSLLPSLETKHNQDFEIVDFKIGDENAENIIDAYNKVQQSMVPLPTTEIEQRLTMLATIVTLANNFDPKMMDIKRKALTSELEKYPADIVMYAFDEVTKRTKFWPSFAEFYTHIEWQFRIRKLLHDKLYYRVEKYI